MCSVKMLRFHNLATAQLIYEAMNWSRSDKLTYLGIPGIQFYLSTFIVSLFSIQFATINFRFKKFSKILSYVLLNTFLKQKSCKNNKNPCRNLADTPREGPIVDANRVSDNKFYWTLITMSGRVLNTKIFFK